MYDYLIPVISSLPPRYMCTSEFIPGAIGKILTDGCAEITWSMREYFENQVISESIVGVIFKNGELIGPAPRPFTLDKGDKSWTPELGFLESSVQITGGDARFRSNLTPAAYVIYTAPDRKAVFSDSALRYAAPSVISQISVFGKFCMTYSAAGVDRARDQGESIIMINPYKRDIVARIDTYDGRSLTRIRVPSLSARIIPLIDLLKDEEDSWFGRIQISANNRVITFDLQHSITEPTLLTDHEHHDPFRGDPTHAPMTWLLRYRLHRFMRFVGLR